MIRKRYAGMVAPMNVASDHSIMVELFLQIKMNATSAGSHACLYPYLLPGTCAARDPAAERSAVTPPPRACGGKPTPG